MKTRQEIKLQAKQAFYGNYWMSVGVNVVAMLLIGAASSIVPGIGGFILIGPMLIGLGFFSLSLYRGMQADFDVMFNKGFTNFGRNLGGYLFMQLFIFLWSLLLIVPGIIKSLSYALTPYILADCPNVSATDALKVSMRMMNGHKWELFVFGLSFIGWMLLSALTFGLLQIFFVTPYMNTALAGYYSERKIAALNECIVTAEELG